MKRDLALWTGVLAGPVNWAMIFTAKFFLAPWICAFHWKPAAYVLSVLALALTAGAGLLAWSQWQQVGREYPGQGGGAVARSRAMAFGGVVLSSMFFLVLIAITLPELLLEGCE